MRRTKQEAARTRSAIVEGALRCFDRYGIAHSTLEQIARESGVTRGAVYHYFGGKRDILRAIREQVSVPLLDEADTELLKSAALPALERIERFLLGVLHGLEKDPRKRVAFTVMQFKCEYVQDMGEELACAARNTGQLVRAFESAYRQAHVDGSLAPGVKPRIAALETMMFLSGLLRLWLLGGSRSAYRKDAQDIVRAHVRSRGGTDAARASPGASRKEARGAAARPHGATSSR
ncbi:MAG TPA: TetR family transcriptional regulator [Usitatibacter sp.]|jgi:TetR/AcrR family acrAB operon transcriptional repressor|nr:TetR family transcriptional regulator [Usitatibacter sp.]